MCLDNNAIEHQAKNFFKEIQEHSIYQPIKLLVDEGKYIPVLDNNEIECITSSVLIKKIFLSDSDGKLYAIEPNRNGLRFAKGEMNYREYSWKCKKEMGYGIVILLMSLGFLISFGWIIVKFLS